MDTDRSSIINALEKGLLADDNVHAFWLEGADAHGTADEYSDIDMWFDVEDGYENQFIEKLKLTLNAISPVGFFYEKKHGNPKIRQLFMRLENTPEFLIIDLCLQSHSRKIEFIKDKKDEKVKIIFDKSKVIKFTNLNKDDLNDGINMRKKEIEHTFEFFAVTVKKEIRRGNFLEALSCYNEYILSPLTEYLRLLFEPTKKDFHLKHINADLPSDVVNELEYIYKINSLIDIEEKTDDAIVFFRIISNREIS